ncbi:MAG: hypothetical protein PUP93_06270 [Rhizonema sp. NSF051]|nr:hypothetical protein [Rhizonema sp. NSF051]
MSLGIITEEEFRSHSLWSQNELLCDWWMNNGKTAPGFIRGEIELR